jgi:hypothetical protein
MKWTTGNTVLAVGGVGLLLFITYQAFNPTQPLYTPPPGGSAPLSGGNDALASFFRGVTGGIGDIIRSGGSPSGNNTSQSGRNTAGGAVPASGPITTWGAPVSERGSYDASPTPYGRSGAYSPTGGFDTRAFG